MKYSFIIGLLMWVSVISYSQTIGLSFGSHFIQDKVLTERQTYDDMPRPFMFVGINYVHHTGVSIEVSYTFDLHIITLKNSVPLFNTNKNKWRERYALLNNNKL